MRLPVTVRVVPDSEAWLRSKSGKSCSYVVEDADNVVVGLLEKVRNEPWKAFVGVGHDSRYVGSSHEGRGKAIDMIVAAGRT